MVFKYNKSASVNNFSVQPKAKGLTAIKQLSTANVQYLKSLGFKIKK